MSNTIHRSVCTVCGGRNLQPFLSLPAFPVFQGCVAFPPEPDELAPMPWERCETCGSAQIATLPTLERIYRAGHATGLGVAWARHHAHFAAFLKCHSRGAIVDVGGGSGTLAIAYRAAGGSSPWTILEPNALRSPSLPADVTVVDGFLGGDRLQDIGAETIVLCHVFEHFVDLRGAVALMSEALPQAGRIIIAWPELETWIARGQAGALNFEHGLYLTVDRLIWLFSQFGWGLVGKDRWAENDTVFLAFSRQKQTLAPPGAADCVAAIIAYFQRFSMQALRLQTLLPEGSDAFLMPASIYAQALLAAGLRETAFRGLLDNSSVKQKHRLFGTSLFVHAPAAILPDAKHPIVVLNGGAHQDEMASGLRATRSDVVLLGIDGEVV